MVVLDSKSIADAMEVIARFVGSKTSYLIQRIGAYSLDQPECQVACVYACKAHGSLSLYDDPRMTNSARLQRTVHIAAALDAFVPT